MYNVKSKWMSGAGLLMCVSLLACDESRADGVDSENDLQDVEYEDSVEVQVVDAHELELAQEKSRAERSDVISRAQGMGLEKVLNPVKLASKEQ